MRDWQLRKPIVTPDGETVAAGHPVLIFGPAPDDASEMLVAVRGQQMTVPYWMLEPANFRSNRISPRLLGKVYAEATPETRVLLLREIGTERVQQALRASG